MPTLEQLAGLAAFYAVAMWAASVTARAFEKWQRREKRRQAARLEPDVMANLRENQKKLRVLVR